MSSIVVPPAEAGVEDTADLWFTARNSDVRVMNASGRIRLDSWKGIAGYLKTSVRTVQRWEKYEGLPVHRHAHSRQDTVYAYTDEIEDVAVGSQIDTARREERRARQQIAFLQAELASASAVPPRCRLAICCKGHFCVATMNFESCRRTSTLFDPAGFVSYV